MTEVSECFSATEQQQKLSIHSRKRRTSSEHTRSQKSCAVQLTWSRPQFLECSRLGLRESASGTDPSQASAFKHKGTHAGIRALKSKPPSAVPTGLDVVLEPSAAQLSNAVSSLTQPSSSQVIALMQESRVGKEARAAISLASQDSGMCIPAVQAEPPRATSAPARVRLAALKPDVLRSAPTRRHRSTEQKPMGTKGHAYLAPSDPACQRPRPQPGTAVDDVRATSLQWGGAAGDTQSMSERPRSAAALAGSSSGRAANATQNLLQVSTLLCRIPSCLNKKLFAVLGSSKCWEAANAEVSCARTHGLPAAISMVGIVRYCADTPLLVAHWDAVRCVLQMWTNPIQPPVQACLPSLEDLACGNTRGLRPDTITKAQLDTARPLQQVKAHPTTEQTGHRCPSTSCILARTVHVR